LSIAEGAGNAGTSQKKRKERSIKGVGDERKRFRCLLRKG